MKLLRLKIIENFHDQLRHTWNFISLLVNFLKIYFQNCQTEIDFGNNNDEDNNNNNMEEHGPVDINQAPLEPQEEVMDDASDEEADEASDIGDDDEIAYSSASEEASDWSSSVGSTNDGEACCSSASSSGSSIKKDAIVPIYNFQPLRLLKCHYKTRVNGVGFPLARSGHRIIASNSNLYSLGGYNPRSALAAARRGQCLLFQELWSYNFATNEWKLMLNADNAKDMPVELASNALAIQNNVLISHGGTGYPFGETCSNDCYIYTTGEKPNVMRLKVTGDLPTAQYGPGIVIHEDYLYTIGGTTGFDYSCDVYRLNLKTKVWENMYICRPEMRDDPEGRYRHEVVYDGKHIFVLGGGTSHLVYDLQRIPAYNLEANRWDYFDTLPDRSVMTREEEDGGGGAGAGYPKPRKCFSCVQHKLSNGDIEAFITGGLQGDFSTYFSDIWKLNLRTKQWMRIQSANLPRPLYFHSAAHADNSCMYIFGGIEYNEKDMRRRNDLYKMWMTVPKLSEMCWDAMTYYNDSLNRFDRLTLLKAGIPLSFVHRLPPQRVRKSDSEQVQSLYTPIKRRRAQLD